MQDKFSRSGLTEQDVVAIRERYAAGEKQRDLAREYSVSQGTVHDIVTGKRYTEAGGPVSPLRRHASDADRFWSHVRRGEADECWEWTAAVMNTGYGLFRWGGRGGSWCLAHRYAYEALVGAIPAEESIHHVCENKRCCNPAHMQPMSQADHIRISDLPKMIARRENRCLRGHELTEENTYSKVDRKGRRLRQCRICLNAAQRRYRARKSCKGGD